MLKLCVHTGARIGIPLAGSTSGFHSRSLLQCLYFNTATFAGFFWIRKTCGFDMLCNWAFTGVSHSLISYIWSSNCGIGEGLYDSLKKVIISEKRENRRLIINDNNKKYGLGTYKCQVNVQNTFYCYSVIAGQFCGISTEQLITILVCVSFHQKIYLNLS